MLVSVDDTCEVFYRASKVDSDKDTITIQYVDLPTVSAAARRAPGAPAAARLPAATWGVWGMMSLGLAC
jgi:hypothetical protein